MLNFKAMKFPIIILFLLGFLSCNKYLDKPGDPTKKVPRTVNDVLLLLDKPINCGPIVFGSDEYFVTQTYFQSTMRPLPRHCYTSWITNLDGNFLHNAYWQLSYDAVFVANLSLEVLSKADVNAKNQKDHDNAKGAAYFLRAYALTTIAWQFAKPYDAATAKTDPGVVIDLNSAVTETLKRSSVDQTYAQIISDIEESLKYLPVAANHPLRPSQLAARGLLARVYLSMRQYNKALEQCNLVLAKRNELIDYNNTGEMNTAATFPLAVHRYGKEVIYNKQSYAFALNLANLNNYPIDTNLVASYATDDLRKAAWFRLNPAGYPLFKGSFESNNHMTGICTSEMYITRAECYARANEIDKAMKDLNDLLVNRWKSGSYIPYTAATKEEALEIILRERRKELVGRGLRWMDIRRLNQEGANITITRKVGDQLYQLTPGDVRFTSQIPQVLVLDYGYVQNPTE
jgi:hypothetical protein